MSSTDFTQMMPREQFWGLIGRTRRESNGDYESQLELITECLLQLSQAEIVHFQNTLRVLMAEAYDWKLWAAAYIINQGCSDDCFEDFRGWLISHGEQTYKTALRNPDVLAELIEDDGDTWEGLLYCAPDAYREVFEQDIPKGRQLHVAIKGQEWEEGDLPELLPRLAQRYAF